MCSFIIIGVNTRQREQDRLYGVNRKTFVCKLWLMNQTQVFQQRQGVLQLGSRKHENVCGIQRKVKITISYLRYGESSCFLSAQNVLNVNVQNMLPKLPKHIVLNVSQPYSSIGTSTALCMAKPADMQIFHLLNTARHRKPCYRQKYASLHPFRFFRL